MKKYCLALDLKNDPALIAEYEAYHKAVWSEIIESATSLGILKTEILRTGNRLVMLIETGDDFSFEEKATSDENNPKVQEWETLMWKYQKALPHASKGEKWMLMESIYLSE